MNIFGKSPFLKVMEELGASPEGEPSWWADTIAQGLREASLEDQSERIDVVSAGPSELS